MAPSLLAPKSASVVHFAMVMAMAAIAATCWVWRDSVVIDIPQAVSRVFRYLALAELIVGGLVISRLRANIPPIAPFDDVAAWWATNGTQVLTTWVLACGVGVTGAGLWLLTDDVVVLVTVVPASIVMLLRLAPRRWVAEAPDQTSKLVP